MFGTDGIRGFPNKGLFIKKNLTKIGYSFGISLKRNNPLITNVFLSKDTRSSSSFIEENLILGLNQAGINTIRLGVLPTSSLSIFTNKYPYSAGIMVTASHNSFEYNGIKFINSKGEKISNKEEKQIESLFKKKKMSLHSKTVNIEYLDSQKEYILEIIQKFKNSNLGKNKYCIDVANGASYLVTKEIFKNFNQKFHIISNRPNGMNINKNCGVEHIEKLSRYVISNKLDFGVSIDGDADRVVFVNKKGKLIDGDKIIAFIAENLLDKGETLVTTIMTNNIIEQTLRQREINVERTDVGDKNVYHEMVKVSSNFGGENSGHYIIRQFLNTSDANLTLILLLSILNKKKLSFDFIDKIKLNPSLLKSYKINKKKPLKSIKSVQSFIKNFNKKYKKNSYLNIRYSGTENKIRILIQGLEDKHIKKEIYDFEEIIKELN